MQLMQWCNMGSSVGPCEISFPNFHGEKERERESYFYLTLPARAYGPQAKLSLVLLSIIPSSPLPNGENCSLGACGHSDIAMASSFTRAHFVRIHSFSLQPLLLPCCMGLLFHLIQLNTVLASSISLSRLASFHPWSFSWRKKSYTASYWMFSFQVKKPLKVRWWVICNYTIPLYYKNIYITWSQDSVPDCVVWLNWNGIVVSCTLPIEPFVIWIIVSLFVEFDQVKWLNSSIRQIEFPLTATVILAVLLFRFFFLFVLLLCRFFLSLSFSLSLFLFLPRFLNLFLLFLTLKPVLCRSVHVSSLKVLESTLARVLPLSLSLSLFHSSLCWLLCVSSIET